MNLRDRRQAENRLLNMNASLQTDGSKRTQNWSDTTEKYKMLLEEQSETSRTQKDTISEQERIIRQQTLDIGKQGKKITELQSNLEQGRNNLTETENNLREQYESDYPRRIRKSCRHRIWHRNGRRKPKKQSRI